MSHDDTIYKIPQVRWFCSYCKASGWWIPSRHIGKPPLEDHDSPSGGRCFVTTEAYKTARLKGMPQAGGTHERETK